MSQVFNDVGPSDAEAQFAAVYDANFSAVLGYAMRRVEQPADAADVVGETFAIAWRRFGVVPPGDCRPWLFGIARHVLANHHRSARRRTRLGGKLRDVLRAEPTPDPAVGVAESDRLRRVLARLRPEDRELLMLTSWDGLTPSEAAEVVGISPGAARMRLARARQRAQALLADQDATEEQESDAGPDVGHVLSVPTNSASGSSDD